jgi:hypothetical protein
MLSLKVESKLQFFANLQVHVKWAQLNAITQKETNTDHNKQKMITLADLPLPLNGTCEILLILIILSYLQHYPLSH